ncbi:MAG: EVE domain-containing protein [Candidatus Tectomicrobia bacterium]|nr:EVE domain-containing protein [Candidatus Tectomicrobia bacterium]
MPRHWLMKSEPSVFSFDDLLARPGKTDGWEGVRNYQARNHMRAMKKGDRVLFYHSTTEPPHVAGLAEVVREAYPDHTALDPKSRYYDPRSAPSAPRWHMVDVRAVSRLPRPVSLPELKANPRLKKMLIVQKGQRLSVQPVTKEEFGEVVRMAKETGRRRNR